MSIRRAFFDKNQFFCLTRHILLVQHYEFSIFDTNLDMVFQSSGVRASDDFLFLLQKSTIGKEGKQCPQPATPQSTTKFCATERFPSRRKGLFAVIKSFVGLPDFALSKRRLGYACSDSAYLLNAAWKELKQKGYLQHYFSQAENGAFCHVYNLMQHPSEPVDFVYSPSIDRPNGDVACISGAQRDYTNISTSVLRDKTISLASKGLFALVSHLMKIPGFVLRPEGIRSFCMEKIKHFSTLWKRFKISGLLKQHRHPAGEENRWTYEYEICEMPDLETPYLTNHHVDGSISTI